MSNQIQDRLAVVIPAMDVAGFEAAMQGESNVRIAIEALGMVHTLSQEAQDWWYKVMAPIVMKKAKTEVTPEMREEGRAWSEHHRGDAAILSEVTQDLLCGSEDGLLMAELLMGLEAVRPQLPHPDCAIEEITPLILLGLLDRKAVWQTDDCRLHASRDSRVVYPAATGN